MRSPPCQKYTNLTKKSNSQSFHIQLNEIVLSLRQPLILLMDGQESLWNVGLTYLPLQHFEITNILDLLHVVSYIWQVPQLFHPVDSDRALSLVRNRCKASSQVMTMIFSCLTLLSRRGGRVSPYGGYNPLSATTHAKTANAFQGGNNFRRGALTVIPAGKPESSGHGGQGR